MQCMNSFVWQEILQPMYGIQLLLCRPQLDVDEVLAFRKNEIRGYYWCS